MVERISLEAPTLVVVDLQNGDAHPGSAYVARKTDELGDEARAYFVGRLTDLIVPNARRLIDRFHGRGRSVVYARIRSLTADGRDRGRAHRERGIHFPPGSWDGEILEELAPEPNDIVVSKTAGSAYVGTGLAEILGNLGTRDLVVLGAVTGSCVRATVLDALRLRTGRVFVVDDACAAWSEAAQRSALAEMRAAGAEVAAAADVLAALGEAAQS